MDLDTNLRGRLRNTNLAQHDGLFPVFEAVVNSIHSLEEREKFFVDGKIILNIKRSGQSSLVPEKQDIVGFDIEDNGVGFDNDNMKSFQTLDSEHKIDKGCKGIGRLLWLKAFNYVKIESIFNDIDHQVRKRFFAFNLDNGVVEKNNEESSSGEVKTTVILSGFKEKYRKSTPKNIDHIAKKLLEHCLWYFVRDEGVPLITVKDGTETVDLNSLYDTYMCEDASQEKIKIKKHDFNLTHIKFRASTLKKHGVSFCAASRLVKEEPISGKIPGLYGEILDKNGDFIYNCYVSSSYLDNRVRSERTSFDISESEKEDLFSENEISLNEIRKHVLDSARNHLQEYLFENIEAGRKRIDKYISEKAPRYRPIISRVNGDELAVDPKMTDQKLELYLHKIYVGIERKMLRQGHEIVDNFNKGAEGYGELLSSYLSTLEDVKKSDLANYVSHRKVILDILEKAIQRNEGGGYVKENMIHELIMPMGKDSNDVLFDPYNLWLIDERLVFHNYLASDKTLNSMPITGSKETKEPDICALNVCDNPILVSEKSSLPLASITIIEFKRPMRNDAKSGEDKDPIEQALGYLARIREGKVNTANGRPIPRSDEIPGYCYVICDLTSTMQKRCQIHDLTETSDRMGFFGYHKFHKAYIEVISYDKLVVAAKERNRAFFDRLGLPSS